MKWLQQLLGNKLCSVSWPYLRKHTLQGLETKVPSGALLLKLLCRLLCKLLHKLLHLFLPLLAVSLACADLAVELRHTWWLLLSLWNGSPSRGALPAPSCTKCCTDCCIMPCFLLSVSCVPGCSSSLGTAYGGVGGERHYCWPCPRPVRLSNASRRTLVSLCTLWELSWLRNPHCTLWSPMTCPHESGA